MLAPVASIFYYSCKAACQTKLLLFLEKKSSASTQRQTRHTEKFQGAETSVEDAVTIF
jgi:hypothetical protein